MRRVKNWTGLDLKALVMGCADKMMMVKCDEIRVWWKRWVMGKGVR